MRTATTFSRQNDAGSRMSNTQKENIEVVVALVSEFKALSLVKHNKYRRSSGINNQLLFLRD